MKRKTFVLLTYREFPGKIHLTSDKKKCVLKITLRRYCFFSFSSINREVEKEAQGSEEDMKE